jgi:hypothetical protein
MCLGEIVSGLFASNAQSKATDAQVQSSQAALDLQREQFAATQANIQPFLESGARSQAAYDYEMGLGPRPMASQLGMAGQAGSGQNALAITESQVAARPGAGSYQDVAQPNSRGGEQMLRTFVPSGPSSQFAVGDQNFSTRADAQGFIDAQSQGGDAGGGAAGGGGFNALNFDYGGFDTTPGYEFRVAQGRQAIERSAAARGGLNSGATMKALEGYGQGMAADEYGTFMNRLAAGAGRGQTATNSLAGFGQNFANTGSNTLIGQGNARASGYIGQGNIITNGFNNLSRQAGQAMGMGF